MGYSAKSPMHTPPAYLEPNRNAMQKPIEGLSALALYTLFKRGGE
jgi:hypothetical protein